MEQSDLVYERFGPAKGIQLKILPSEYFERHAMLGFQIDHNAVAHRHTIGLENLAWGNDFPHSAGDWPHSQRIIDDQFAGVPDDERRMMDCDSVARFYRMA